MRDIRHEKLSSLVHRRASEVILYELKDPRLGFVTVTRVKLSKDLRHATIFWSVVGADSDRSKTTHALEHARGFIQSEVASALSTRVTPTLDFEYDESVEGSVRVSRILDDLRRIRGEDAEPADKEEE
jgi:ribosome-binding factor A